MKKDKIISGSLLLAAGAFLSKLIGAFYRVPLTNFLGGEGLGLYQMIFPVYSVLLDFSGAGAPNAISKLVAENQEKGYAENLLKGSVRIFALIGLIGSFLMLALSYPLSTAQGNNKASLGYVFLSPAVFLVSIISCYRGYFQGKMRMSPTAISQVIEQAVKLLVGLLLAYSFKANLPWAVAGATLAVTVSELVALLYLYVTYKTYENKLQARLPFDKTGFKAVSKRLYKYAVLVSLIGILLPLSQVIDSFLIVNIIGSYRTDATALYGLYSGAATTVINLPVAICYGVATVAIPAVSGVKTLSEKSKNSTRALYITLAVALPCTAFCYIFAPFIVGLLFSRLNAAEIEVTVRLIKYMSVNVAFLSLLQTENAILVGFNKAQYPLIGMGVGVLIKTAINFILLPNPNFNIYASVIGVIACYFTACLVNLILIIKIKVQDENKVDKRWGYNPS